MWAAVAVAAAQIAADDGVDGSCAADGAAGAAAALTPTAEGCAESVNELDNTQANGVDAHRYKRPKKSAKRQGATGGTYYVPERSSAGSHVYGKEVVKIKLKTISVWRKHIYYYIFKETTGTVHTDTVQVNSMYD